MLFIISFIGYVSIFMNSWNCLFDTGMTSVVGEPRIGSNGPARPKTTGSYKTCVK